MCRAGSRGECRDVRSSSFVISFAALHSAHIWFYIFLMYIVQSQIYQRWSGFDFDSPSGSGTLSINRCRARVQGRFDICCVLSNRSLWILRASASNVA